MEWIYLLYALAILAVVASLPLRLKARRRGREELEQLASMFQHRIEELSARVEVEALRTAVDSQWGLADARLHRRLDALQYRAVYEPALLAEAVDYSWMRLREGLRGMTLSEEVRGMTRKTSWPGFEEEYDEIWPYARDVRPMVSRKKHGYFTPIGTA